MNRAIVTPFAYMLASCGHVATPLPPQPPQETSPIFIINVAQSVAHTRASKLKPATKPSVAPSATPDVVAIAWSLRDTIVWDGRSSAQKTVHRVPRRQGVLQSGEPKNKTLDRARRGVVYSAPLQCGYGYSRHGVGFPGRNSRWNADDARPGRCRRDVMPAASITGRRMRSRPSHRMSPWRSDRRRSALSSLSFDVVITTA